MSIGDTLESAEKGHKHVPIQRIPNKPNAGVSVIVKEPNGIELREIAAVGVPAPLGEFSSVGFVSGDAIPALEDLLTGVVVPRSPRVVVDPFSIGIVTGTVLDLEGAKGKGGCRGGGVSELRENDEDGSEAEKREKWKQRGFLCVLGVRFPCACGHAR